MCDLFFFPQENCALMTTVSLMGHLTVILCAVSLGQQTGYLVGLIGFLELSCLSPRGRVFPLAPRELTVICKKAGTDHTLCTNKGVCHGECRTKAAMVIATM